MDHIWYWFAYSFLGYCLEKLFAAATSSSHRLRRCFVTFFGLDHCVVIEYGHKNIVTVQPDNEEAFMERIKNK